MDWSEKVNQALSYIEKNLYCEIQFKEIEKIILSPIDVLQRFFMLNTGITLTEYIRRRKPDGAAKTLRSSNDKIIDIAMRSGYGSSDAFSLAFKRLCGISPSEARQSDVALKPYPRMVFSLSITYLEGDVEMKNINKLALSLPEKQEIFIMPDVRIIGVARKCLFESDDMGATPHDDYWNEFLSHGSLTNNLPYVIKDSLVCWTGDSPQGSDYYTYMPGVICPANTPVPAGLDYRDLPASYVAKGVYGDEVADVVKKFKPQGFVTCYTDLGWNAKLFLSEGEKKNHHNAPCRWLVPCIKVDEV